MRETHQKRDHRPGRAWARTQRALRGRMVRAALWLVGVRREDCSAGKMPVLRERLMMNADWQEKIIRRGGLGRDGLFKPANRVGLSLPRVCGGWSSNELLLGTDEGAKSFGQKRGVERFLERLVDARAIEAGGAAVVGQQGDQDHLGEVDVAAQILTDL